MQQPTLGVPPLVLEPVLVLRPLLHDEARCELHLNQYEVTPWLPSNWLRLPLQVVLPDDNVNQPFLLVRLQSLLGHLRECHAGLHWAGGRAG